MQAYNLVSAHSRYAKSVFFFKMSRFPIIKPPFCRLYKIVFPNGLDAYDTPTPSIPSSRQGSLLSIAAHQALSSPSPSTPASTISSISSRSIGFLGRLGLSRAATPSGASTPTSIAPPTEDGPIEDLIISGTAFGLSSPAFTYVLLMFPASTPEQWIASTGHGLFNLVLSLLPAKVKCV